MRRGLVWIGLALAASCNRPVPPTAAPATAAQQPGQSVTISVVATTDVHGHLESLPWLSGHVENLRAARRADGGGVLLVDAGDMW